MKSYGIQLVASHNLNAVKQFARTYHIYGQAQYYKRKYKGKTWYVLIYGRYPNYRAAASAIRSLPRAVRERKLWVRSIKDLKKI